MKEIAQIFLSYAREDKERVEHLYERLSATGFKPWMDTEDILPGEKWELCIQSAIRKSEFFLVCLSSNSVNKRGFLQKEIKSALDIWKEKLESDIYLIPARLEACDAPENLNAFQWVNLYEGDGWERLVKALIAGNERRSNTGKRNTQQPALFDLKAISMRSPQDIVVDVSDNGTEKVKALESLLGFIEQHKGEDSALDQIPAAISLAKECVGINPEAVAYIFKRLDKLLKRLGNKQIVLEVAELSIGAAETLPRPRKPEIVDAHAQALICGVSWVYQRLGRLDKARVAAKESLRLGEDVKSGINSAYCTKCLGRLYRIEAEEAQDKEQKESKLRESIALLEDSIDRFAKLDRFGPMDPEVGDCYSLLGRTYLVAGNLAKAEESIRKAYERIPDKNSKDYFDLVLLSGDFEVERGNRRDGANYYDEALRLPTSKDPEITEMRARAYFQRGQNRAVMKDQEGAKQDFKKAIEIWQSLGEIASASKAQWEEICLVEKLPTDISALLNGEEPPVRVAAVELYKQRIAPLKGRRVAQRAKPGREYWKQLIEEARARVA